MAGNGYDWIHDWYDPDYYKYSPVVDPGGQKNRCISVARILTIQKKSIRRYCGEQIFQDLFGG
ncbi:hypothetical protein O5189_03080 [Escherichia coli]|nr:hypothetical protein [Escherichia coli]